MPQYDTESKDELNFRYPDTNNPILSKLRETAELKLDTNLSGLEKVRTILGYAHNLFTHNGDNQPPATDPLTILLEAQAGRQFRCVEYSILGAALLWAYGIPARTLGLKTRDVETREYGAGHVVVEHWSREYHKWIMCDVQVGVIPTSEETLLSAFELGEKIEQNLPVEYIPVEGSRFHGDIQAYVQWVEEYLYFFDTMTTLTFDPIDQQKEEITMLVPLGVVPPKMFQGMFEMNAVYTNSIESFYAAPASSV